MSNSEIIEWLKKKAETVPMPGCGKSLKRTNPCTVINTRRILLINIHKSPKMRDGLQKGASPSSIGLNILS